MIVRSFTLLGTVLVLALMSRAAVGGSRPKGSGVKKDKPKRPQGKLRRSEKPEKILIQPDVNDAVKDASNKTDELPKYRLPLEPAVEYLGLLLDGGRHYFKMEFIERLLDYLYQLRFNLLHFRLTDDQTFNVRLESVPDLAFPTTFRNPEQLVYTPEELRRVVKYAKARNISVMPEINVPGHGGAWGGMIVNCPEFVCTRGYGLPLNVYHETFMPTLKKVLTEIIDIFDRPPLLHLGGDEVAMAQPCFEEAKMKMFEYTKFEKQLMELLKEIGYPESQVNRWEVTLPYSAYGDVNTPKVAQRAGKIEQFWESLPGERKNASSDFIVSRGLYLDSNRNEGLDVVYGYTREIFQAEKVQRGYDPKAILRGIIVGAFELDEEYFQLRNVYGRLLAVALGAAKGAKDVMPDQSTNDDDDDDLGNEDEQRDEGRSERAEKIKEKKEKRNAKKQKLPEVYTGESLKGDYMKYCPDLGLNETVCGLFAAPPMEYDEFRQRWSEAWVDWKKGICHRLTEGEKRTHFSLETETWKQQHLRTFKYYWGRFQGGMTGKVEYNASLGQPDIAITTQATPIPLEMLKERLVEHSGVFIDFAEARSSDISEKMDDSFFGFMSNLGFNLMQLRLVNELAMSDCIAKMLRLGERDESILSTKNTEDRWTGMVKRALAFNVSIMPEIPISTNAGGWRSRGTLARCPYTICEQGVGIPNDVSDGSLLPILTTTIYKLRKVFSSKYISLGQDERKLGNSCLKEAGLTAPALAFNDFERRFTKALEMEGLYDQDHIVRWENAEGKLYPNRNGKITQYRAGDKIRDTATPFFASIDVFAGGPWGTYDATRTLAETMKPTSLQAEIPSPSDEFDASDVNRRLLAFSMGIADEKRLGKTEFGPRYSELCGHLNLTGCDEFLSGSFTNNSNVLEVDTEEQKDIACRRATFTKQYFVMRPQALPAVNISEAPDIPIYF